MRRVAQRDFDRGDCGIACAAVLARCGYDEAHGMALKLGLERDGTFFTNHAQMQRLLKSLGIATSRHRFTTMREIAAPSLVKVNPYDSGYRWHWIVLAEISGKRVIFDPKPGKPPRIERFSGYKGAGIYLRALQH